MKPAGYLIGASTCAGPYKIANCLIEERMVYTNKIPCGHMRAPGDPARLFRQREPMDIVARKLGMDPAEFKRKNMLQDGDETPIGGHISHIRGNEALDKAIEMAGLQQAKPKNVGRGLAFSEWSPSGGEGSVFVTIEEDGKVKIISPVVDQGAGVLTVIVEVVGEELQVPADEIELIQTDSTTCRATAASAAAGRRGFTATPLAKPASRRARSCSCSRRKRLEVDPKELELDRGMAWHKTSKRKMSFAEVIKFKGSPIHVLRLLQELGEIPRRVGVGADLRSSCRPGDRPGDVAQHDLGAYHRQGDQSANAPGTDRRRRGVRSRLCADRRDQL